jgi:hypothetical protein
MSRRTTVGAGISLGALLAVPATAHGDDFTVTNLNDDGPGSLRRAVSDAANSPGPNRILFQSKLSGTINLTNDSGDFPALYISYQDVEVIGPGAKKLTVEAPPGFPAFAPFATAYGAPAIDVAISGLRITGGDNASGFFGGDGGGIQTYGDVDLTLSKVTVAGNSADGEGGGVANIPAGQPSSLTIEDSTISGNSAGGGGGVYFLSASGGELEIRNSTISGNHATAEDGGGIFLSGTDAPTAEILSSTITRNSANERGGGLYESNDGGTLHGSIIAGNTAADDNDLEGGPWPTSFSLIGDTAGLTLDDQGGNLFDVDPNLKPLNNNGGPTNTHAFKKSPAKNAGPSDAPSSDQRGAPRKGQPDIGAYEFTKCKGVVVNRVGTGKKDKLKGTKRKDGILGLGGNDVLKGKKGKDGLCGGKGKDKLKGGPGKDKLDGGPGKDKEIQ